jgi:2-furoyl-CoA dehydrogenase large subunit
MSLPVAIANAVADALAPLGVDINALPIHGSVLFDLLPDRDAVLGPHE